VGGVAVNGLAGACTIASANYLPLVRSLSISYCKHHPDHEFYVLIVARGLDRSKFAQEPYRAVFLEDIGLPDLSTLAMKYGILELNTNVKPRFMLYLLEQMNLGQLLYLDPDIFVYSRLDPVFELLSGHDMVLTPHLTVPSINRIAGFEQDVLFNGTYNLGFLGVRKADESIRMLRWWDKRCRDLGFSEGRTGLFVDQKWINLVPGLFDSVALCKHPGCNMASWNLEERTLTGDGERYRVNGTLPLYFFHFSGIALDSEDVFFRNTKVYTPATNPELIDLFRTYRTTVRENRFAELDSIPYGFDEFDNGVGVTLLARRIFAANESVFAGEDPFGSGSRFYAFADQNGLLAGKAQHRRVGWSEFRKDDKRVQAVHKLLRLVLKLVGPNKYELLMKYMGFISVLRNQATFIK
jgi:hypothetical protein